MVVAIRPEQVHITAVQEPGSLPVKVYANQPAGSETLVSLQAGKSDFLSKQIRRAKSLLFFIVIQFSFQITSER